MSTVLRALALVFGLVLVLALAGCGSTQATKSGDGGTSTSETNKNPHLHFGNAAEYGGWTVTVTSAADLHTEVVTEPTFVVSVTYKNATDEEIPCADSDWEIEDANGERSQEITSLPAVAASDVAALPPHVPPGTTASGVVTFTGTISRAGKKIVYTPPKSLGDVDEAVWFVNPWE